MRVYFDSEKRCSMRHQPGIEEIIPVIESALAAAGFPVAARPMVQLAIKIVSQSIKGKTAVIIQRLPIPLAIKCQQRDFTVMLRFHFEGGAVVWIEAFDRECGKTSTGDWLVSYVAVQGYWSADRCSKHFGQISTTGLIGLTQTDQNLKDIRIAQLHELSGEALVAITDPIEGTGEVCLDCLNPWGSVIVGRYSYDRRIPGDRERATSQADRRLRQYSGNRNRNLMRAMMRS